MTTLLFPLLAVLAAAPPEALPAAPPASPPAWSAVTSTPPAESPSPAALAVARGAFPPGVWEELLEPMTKGGRNAVAARLLEWHVAASPALLDEIAALLREVLSYEAFVEIYARSVAAVFSASELEEIASFYRTPLGRRMAEAMPMVQKQAMLQARAFASARASQLGPRIDEIVQRHLQAMPKADDGPGAKTSTDR